jgi:Caspase domain/Domain of unknown function (DUF4384)
MAYRLTSYRLAAKKAPRITLIVGVLCVLFAAMATAQGVTKRDGERTGGVKRALLIGINKYRAVQGLQGSVNDVETMREILTKRWGFLPSNITILTDEGATRAKMLAAITQIVAISEPQDTIYFHYSGHGSQVQDFNGDEEDGLDETLVPQDGRTNGVRDIVDDELDVIFSKLRTHNVIVVLDSCHSGTATRSFDIRARSVPQDTRVDLYKTGVTGMRMRGVAPLKESRLVAIGAAADDEEALDGPIEGNYHGFLTFALARALTAADSNATPREIFAVAVQELGRIQATFGRISMPEPQLEGPAEALDRPFFARDSSVPTSAGSGAPAGELSNPRVAWLDAEPAPDGMITLVRGSALGASPGSTWAIYPPGEKLFVAGSARAVATVIQLSGKDSRAQLSADARPIERGSRAIALLPAPAAANVAIRILDTPRAERGRVEEILKRYIKNLVLVGPDQSARFLIDMQDDTVRLLTADGLTALGSFRVNDERAAADVGRMASRSANVVDLLTLDNPTSRLKVNVRVASSRSIASRDIRLVATTAPAQLRVRHASEPRSTENSLQLDIDVNVDSYMTIVDVDSEGSMTMLFPNSYQHEDFLANGAVRGGQHLMIPDSLESGNRAGFYWDYRPPRGTDTVRVFASSDLTTATSIRHHINVLQKGGSSSGDELGALRKDLNNSAERGIKLVADRSPGNLDFPAQIGSADWSAASVTIQVTD